MSRRRRLLLWAVAALSALALLLAVAALVVLPSAWFRDKVRDRIVSETERATGGRVEVGSFQFDWRQLTAEVAPFVLHGTEAVGERPLFRAESVHVGLKVVSAFTRDVDIDSLLVEQPRINILVDTNGKTNFPEPKRKSKPDSKNPVEQLIALAVRRIQLRDGTIHYGDTKARVDVKGEDLKSVLSYNLANLSYDGKLSIRQVMLGTAATLPLAFGLDSDVTLLGNKIQFRSIRASMQHSDVEGSGELVNFKDPALHFDLRAKGSVQELAGPLKLPVQHTGVMQFEGKLNYTAAEKLHIEGHAVGEGLAVRGSGFSVRDAHLSTRLMYRSEDLFLRDLTVRALGGAFHGSADLPHLDTYHLNGKVDGISLPAVAQASGLQKLNFSGTASGPVEVTGSFAKNVHDLRAGGRFDIRAAQGGVPVSGFAELAYDQRQQRLQLGQSYLYTPSTSLDVSGTLGEQLLVKLESRNLHELVPVISAFSDNAPKTLPLELKQGGIASFEGTVAGAMKSPRIAGALTITNFEVQKQKVDRFVATLDANSTSAHVSSFAVGQDTLRLAGSGDVTLQDWRLVDASQLAGKLRLDGARVQKLLTEAGQAAPLAGFLSAAIDLTGTVGSPKAVLRVTVDKPELYGEQFDKFTAEVRYAGPGVEVIDGVISFGSARVGISGAYEHAERNWSSGRLRFDVNSSGLQVQQLATLRKLGPSSSGKADIKASGVVAIRTAEVFPEKLDGKISVSDLVVEGRPVGSFEIDAATAGRQLTLAINGLLRGSKLTGSGQIELAGNYLAKGQVDLASTTLSTLRDLILTARGSAPLPLEGFVAGRLTFSGPAKKPEAMRARVELPTLQLVPARRTVTQLQAQDLALSNQEPIVIEYENGSLHIVSAHMVGRETDLRAAGYLNLNNSKSPWDLQLNGNLNLGALESFNTDLTAAGSAVVNASLRGSLKDPQLGGRLELRKASLSFAPLPNGLDDANGIILFDTRRATIEKLTATTGGGTIGLSGFVGFGNGELTYRMQARADSVRVRYPEGVSTTLNAQLGLTGTSAHSLLAGVVTVRRAGFNPRTDVGGLLASAKPIDSPATPNPFLRGMQLDIRVETIPNLQFQTSLTADLQAEADLRLRGTAAKPAVLGRIVVNQGEIQFFGNKYTINRGEIGLFNPVTIEPVLDLDLETRVRGIIVNISVAGPIKKLNISYRSDPPLQSTEIIALLAVGRAPQSTAALAASQTVTNQSVITTGSNSLLGQAVAAPVSSRLQRFFGVSRLRIDPQLTGLNAVPQARLTVEQQISRDITLTYITNLAQANQQIVRLEWAISRNWSVVALREENGAFGVDFFFKQRFR